MSELVQIGERKPLSIRSSSVKTHEDCERKWWLDWVLGLASGSAATALGSEMHAHIEAWLLKAVPPPDTKAGKLATRLIRLPDYLPLPMAPGLAVEARFTMPTYPGGPEFTGTIDWQDTAGAGGLGDNKSCATLRYALTERSILEHVQPMTYAKKYMDEHGLARVRLRWGYVETRGSSQKLVDVVAQLDNIAKRWERTLATVRTMAETYQVWPEWQDVRPNWSACNDYGGCPHRSRCSAAKKVSSAMGVNPILARLRAGQSIAPGGTQAAPPTTQRATEPEPMPIPELVLAQGVVPPDAPPPTFEAGEEKTTKTRAKKTRVAGAAPPAVTQANEVMDQLRSSVAMMQLRASVANEMAKHVEPATLDAPNVPAIEPERFDENGVDDREAPTSSKLAPTTDVPATSSKLVVYVGCAPTKGSRGVVYLDDLLVPHERVLAEEHAVRHYTSIEYGKGPGLLAAAFEQWLITAELDKAILVRGAVDRAIMTVLLSHADVVIEGLR